MMNSFLRKLFVLTLLVVIVGLLIPQHFVNPVEGSNKSSFNAKSYWYYPWGKSGTHKGVDIFARQGTPVLSSTGGLVIFKGVIERGGNVVFWGSKYENKYNHYYRGIWFNNHSDP